MNRNHKYDTRESYYNRVPLRKHVSVMSRLEVEGIAPKPLGGEFKIRDIRGTKVKKTLFPVLKVPSQGNVDDGYTSSRLAKWNNVYKKIMVVNRFPKPTKKRGKTIISSDKVSHNSQILLLLNNKNQLTCLVKEQTTCI